MDAESAVSEINKLSYMPGWRITAWVDDNPRHRNSVIINCSFDAYNSSLGYAKDNYRYSPIIRPSVVERQDVTECRGSEDVWRLVAEFIQKINEHEMREFLRIPSENYKAPFHPHKFEGMEAWGDEFHDLEYNKI